MEDVLTSMARQFLPQMTREERSEALLSLKRLYKTTWRNYKRTPYPFYEYWVKQAKWDSRARAALPLAMGVVSKVGYMSHSWYSHVPIQSLP